MNERIAKGIYVSAGRNHPDNSGSCSIGDLGGGRRLRLPKELGDIPKSFTLLGLGARWSKQDKTNTHHHHHRHHHHQFNFYQCGTQINHLINISSGTNMSSPVAFVLINRANPPINCTCLLIKDTGYNAVELFGHGKIL